MKYLLGIAAGAATLAIAPAIAQTVQPAPVRAAPTHTRVQVVEHVRAMFARLDANRDGYLTKEEAQAGRRAQGPMRTPEQKAQRHAQGFDRFDANHDGAISRAEWDARSAERQQHRVAMQGQRPGARFGMMGLRGRMFDMADANRDGRLTAAEAQNAALQHFDRVDANRDGTITPEERQRARKQMRVQRRS